LVSGFPTILVATPAARQADTSQNLPSSYDRPQVMKSVKILEAEYVLMPGMGASAAMAEVNVIADRLPDSSYLRLKVYTTWWVRSTLAYMLPTVTLCTYSSVLS